MLRALSITAESGGFRYEIAARGLGAVLDSSSDPRSLMLELAGSLVNPDAGELTLDHASGYNHLP